ncbi:preprotein translocase subunit SecG [Desulfuromonas sp. CSMB_57]|jgi:preprotein translocase subunit SecG|uniref:preprotein translocase subunit SecG n=1 Tax=Desulfuromonas sp. CSMB_57 TaxID=2807629 RepID=UPI001CD1CD36|nr:preprotein translocase subunit SecG [Desulfuromonas sp. CSMB_57]
MVTLLLIVHVLVCLALIAIVLLQGGKGAEIGATFGAGGSQTVFGASGGKNFMSRLTTWAATVFMITSLVLAFVYARPGIESIMPQQVGAPATESAEQRPAPVPAPETAPAAE